MKTKKYGLKAKKILAQHSFLQYTNKLTMVEKPNLINLIQLSNGDEAIKSSLWLVLKQEFSKEVEDYNMKITEKNFLIASEIVHKIRHKIGFLGMYNAYDLSYQYQQNLELNSLDLKEDFELILNTIDEFILKN